MTVKKLTWHKFHHISYFFWGKMAIKQILLDQGLRTEGRGIDNLVIETEDEGGVGNEAVFSGGNWEPSFFRQKYFSYLTKIFLLQTHLITLF